MAELDKKIEAILLQRLTHVIQVWCSEFDRADDGDMRRDTLVGKRRNDKRYFEKVRTLMLCKWFFQYSAV